MMNIILRVWLLLMLLICFDINDDLDLNMLLLLLGFERLLFVSCLFLMNKILNRQASGLFGALGFEKLMGLWFGW